MTINCFCRLKSAKIALKTSYLRWRHVWPRSKRMHVALVGCEKFFNFFFFFLQPISVRVKSAGRQLPWKSYVERFSRFLGRSSRVLRHNFDDGWRSDNRFLDNVKPKLGDSGGTHGAVVVWKSISDFSVTDWLEDVATGRPFAPARKLFDRSEGRKFPEGPRCVSAVFGRSRSLASLPAVWFRPWIGHRPDGSQRQNGRLGDRSTKRFFRFRFRVRVACVVLTL